MAQQPDQYHNAYQLLLLLARAWNRLDVNILAPALAPNMVYTSHWLEYTIEGAANYESYLSEKFAAIRTTGGKTVTRARMAYIDDTPTIPCILLTQITGSEIRQMLFRINTQNNQITHIFAEVPESYENLRLSGEYP